jgi:hypothetical protein
MIIISVRRLSRNQADRNTWGDVFRKCNKVRKVSISNNELSIP